MDIDKLLLQYLSKIYTNLIGSLTKIKERKKKTGL